MMDSYSSAKRIGIMGGSFDPVHIGHLIMAQDAVERLKLSELIFIPAAIPPHKQDVQRIDAEHRFNMLQLAVKSSPHFSVSNIEIQRGGVSYTVDTLKTLRNLYPDITLLLIVGSDTLVELHTWHKIHEILSLCEVATFLRPGEDLLDKIKGKIQLPQNKKDQLFKNIMNVHRIEVSSSEIRMRLEKGLSIRHLVPPEVETYIYKQGLYQD